MSAYPSLLDGKRIDSSDLVKPARKQYGVGCANCPQRKIDAPRMIGLKHVKGRPIMVWGEFPSKRDVLSDEEISGQIGDWFWEKMDAIGIRRKDCDVQNVVRCQPHDKKGVLTIVPTNDTVKCCHPFIEKSLARNHSKAIVHLVLGGVAAKSLLKREYRKDKPIFWSETLNAKVVVTDSPRALMQSPKRHRIITFNQRLRAAKAALTAPGRYEYLEQQDYRLVHTYEGAKAVLRKAKRYAAAGERISVDIESGYVDPLTGKASFAGKPVLLVFGVCWKPGISRIIVVDHPDNSQSPVVRKRIKKLLRKFLHDRTVRKTFHHGSSDVDTLRNLIGAVTRGYFFDTNYSTYLQWPHQKKYGLDEHSKQRVTEFAGYKDIIKPYLVTGEVNYACIPLKVMRLYNGADCDMGKRLEKMTDKVNLPLLRAYTDTAFILAEMQTRGPWFDQRYYDDVVQRVPRRLAVVNERLYMIAGDPDTKLTSPKVLQEIIYDKLRLPVIGHDKNGSPSRTTAKPTLKILAQHKRGEFCKLLIEKRELDKMEGTYLSNYRKSAELHDGQLRTLWWLTGTVTGRLRSGGKDEGADGIVNMQNLHGDPMLKNLLVSDPNWRSALRWVHADNKRKWSLSAKLWKIVRLLTLFLAFDYSQIEIRVLAHMADDPNLIEAVLSGDIHSAVGHDLTGWSVDKIKNDDQVRKLIKNLHFGIIYGMSKPTLHESLLARGVKISRAESDQLYDKYFAKYRHVKQFMEDMRAFAERHGYVETLFGFRRPVFVEGEDDRGTFWGNQAVNSPIQGSAHQLLMFGMASLHQARERERVGIADNPYYRLDTPVMEVHDALVFYVPVRNVRSSFEQGRHLMEKAVPEYVEKHFRFKLKVPLEAEGKAGFRLGATAKYRSEAPSEFVKSWYAKNKEVDAKIEEKWSKAA